MNTQMTTLFDGDLLEDDVELSLAELSMACRLPAETVLEMVEYGLIEPLGRDPAHWRFSGLSVQRVRCAQRLRADLGVNLAGAALALDLLDEIARLRGRLRRLGGE